ncbi:hypothetical protein E4U21_007362 [Claviceps maximensis]|nr:hypothetical protein E4U21_007362 [Claviceps maximensis]
MPPRRNISSTDTHLASAVPPSLPPSVEEAYRRKCVKLKNRTNEVEDANDAARLRLARIKRQVEKLRVERAFLLEQLSKRTSANVEDSDGSPSPPPTPKDKPLRIKRGHRKSALLDVDAKATTNNSLKEPASPSDSQAKAEAAERTALNGVRSSAKTPKSAFELYCLEVRPSLEEKLKDDDGEGGDAEIEEELVRAWDELPTPDREDYQIKVEKILNRSQKTKDVKDVKDVKVDAEEDTYEKEGQTRDKGETHDEDVEMANYDTEDQDQEQDQEQEQEPEQEQEQEHEQDQDQDQEQDQEQDGDADGDGDGETQMDKDGDD